MASLFCQPYWTKNRKNIPICIGNFIGGNQPAGHCAWATGRAVQNAPDTAIELYDLENDPSEQINLTDKYPEKIEAVKKLFKQAHQSSEFWEIKNKLPFQRF